MSKVRVNIDISTKLRCVSDSIRYSTYDKYVVWIWSSIQRSTLPTFNFQSIDILLHEWSCSVMERGRGCGVLIVV